MSDMYGAVTSNDFRVKDVEAFKLWFTQNCHFGNDIEIFVEGDKVSFAGYEQYPSAYPRIPRNEERIDELLDLLGCAQTPEECRSLGAELAEHDNSEWDLDSFAAALREHLVEGQAVHVVAAGHEKLRYVGTSFLLVPAVGAPVYFALYSDDDDLAGSIKRAAAELA